MNFNLDNLLVKEYRGKTINILLVLSSIIIVGFIPIRGLLVLAVNQKSITPLIYTLTLIFTFL